jgi:hypothetical protein
MGEKQMHPKESRHAANHRLLPRIGLAAVLLLSTLAVDTPVFAAAEQVAQRTPAATPLAAERTIDDQFAEVARQVPAFGGMYIDRASGSLVVHLTDTSPRVAAEAEAALYAQFGTDRLAGATATRGLGPAPTKPRVRILPAKYRFAELKEWHERLATGVLALPEVVLTDIDDQQNRLAVGVETTAAQARVEGQLGRLGVPREAVSISVTAPVEYSLTLRDRSRPPVGGQQLTFRSGGINFLCTLGFGAIRQGVLGFVTNSHCSATRGVVDGSSLGGTVFHQPTIGFLGANIVGIERVDPPFFTGGTCPATKQCRYSDALFAEYQVPADRGLVAWPSANNSINWDGTSTLRIIRERSQVTGPLLGDVVAKVGRTTGYTEGVVNRVGANINVANTNITMRAQAQATYSSAGGDSGSAVMTFPFTDPGDGELLGLHWGSGGTFSPSGNIQLTDELGSLNSCAAPLNC